MNSLPSPARRSVSIVLFRLTLLAFAAVAMLTILLPRAGAALPTSDLALWLRADAGTTLSGSAVSQWTDQSGNGRNATQGTSSSRPQLVSNAVNGLPVLRFDGANDFMTFTLPVNGLTAMTIFIVAANTQNQTAGNSEAEKAALFWNETTAWGTVYVSPFQQAVNMRFGTTQSGNRIIYTRSASVGTQFTMTSAIKNGTTDSLYVNGTLVVTEGGKLATIAGCQSTGQLGRGYNDNTYYAGDIAEVLVYNRALTATERQEVEAYLNGRYAVIPTVTPQITSQPSNVTVAEPDGATFSVSATGTPPLIYQWHRGGVPISGATSSSYTLNPTSMAADNGAQFSVVVSNALGSVTSSVATLTVTVPPPTPPGIQTPPANVAVTEPNAANFSVVATGTLPLNYQWRRNGANIGGANASNYTLNPTSTNDSGTGFDVIVGNASGSVTSVVATLTVNAPGTVPTSGLALWLRGDAGIVLNGSAVAQWSDQSGNNRHATQATVANQPTLVNGVLNGLPVVRFDGANDFHTFDLPVNGLGGMSLFLVAANTQNQVAGSSQAERAAIFWNETAVWGTVYLIPFQTTVRMRFGTTQVGNQMTYNRPASVGSNFTISTAIKNGTTDTLYVNGSQVLSHGGKLATIAGCQNTGQLGRGYNNNTFYAGDIAEVLVYDRALSAAERQQVEQYLDSKYGITVPVPPQITSQPASTNVMQPDAANFSIVATGTAPLACQWRRNGVSIAGANSSSYTLTPTSAATDNAAQFDVIVSNASGSVTSAVATLTVTVPPPTPPDIQTPPANVTVTEPNAAGFSVTAMGTAPLAYQWRRNGANIAGANSSNYTVSSTSVAADNGVEFDVVITNAFGAATSEVATLRVNAPQIMGQPVDWIHLSSATGNLPVPPPNSGQSGLRVLDLDQNGQTDYVITLWHAPAIVWFRHIGTNFLLHIIEDEFLDLSHGERFKDIDGDGDIDLIFGQAGRGEQLYWWENPYPDYSPGTSWVRRLIMSAGGFYHDNIWGDFDGDGVEEFVSWNLFAQQLLLFEVPPDPRNAGNWPVSTMFSWTGTPYEYRGTDAIDINLDSKLDFVGGGAWFEHIAGTGFVRHPIDEAMSYTQIKAGQFIAGGRPEVVCVKELETGPLNLYEWTGSAWQPHTLLTN